MTDLGVYVKKDEFDSQKVDLIEKDITFSDKQIIEELPPYTEQTNIEYEQPKSPVKKEKKFNKTDSLINEQDLFTFTLSPLEKLLKFSKSPFVLQRLVITKDIYKTLQVITLDEAITIVLPIIIELGQDIEDSIRETLATDLDKIMYYYYKNASPTFDSTLKKIPKHSFVVTLIEFLLDQNTTLASIAQQSIITVATQLVEDNQFDLLDIEFFEGIVSGLLGIVDHNSESSTLNISNEMTLLINSTANTILKNYDSGGVNLAKMVCLMVISSLAPIFGSKRCEERLLPIIESMRDDPMFYVRKEVATAIGSLSTVVTANVTLDRLLPIYSKLMTDSTWHVRKACVFSLPLLCKPLKPEIQIKTALESVEFFKNDVSRNVRDAMVDRLAELITTFDPEPVPTCLLEFFISLATQHDTIDSDSYSCAFNFPAVIMSNLDRWETHLRSTYLNLTRDYQVKVRRTLACSLHVVARLIGPDLTERDLVQVFALYLMDLDEVKEGVIDHLSDFLGQVLSRDDYIPILAEVYDSVGHNWYLRHSLTRQLNLIVQWFDPPRVVDHILPLALRACHDEFAAIRDSAVDIIPTILNCIKNLMDSESQDKDQTAYNLLNYVLDTLDELSQSNNYRTRLVFTQICKALLDTGIQPEDFSFFFLPRLGLLAKDNVVNVRISVSKVMATLYLIDEFKNKKIMEVVDEIIHQLLSDSDQDVRYFIEHVISKETDQTQQEPKVQLPKPFVFSKLLGQEDEEIEEIDLQDEVMGSPMDISFEEDSYTHKVYSPILNQKFIHEDEPML